MSYGIVPESQWNSMRDLDVVAESIQERAAKIVDAVKTVATQDSFIGAGAASIETDPEGITTVTTSVGIGRFLPAWEVIEGSLHGVLNFQRSIRDEYDRRIWEQVWSLKVPRFEAPFLVDRDKTVRLGIDDIIPNRRAIAAFAVLASMIYGIINGPAKN